MVKKDSAIASLAAGLKTRFIGRNIIYYPRLASTMDTAADEARRGAVEGTVVIAGEQAAGRGRRGRTWLSPEGAVALSVILYPEVSYLPYLVMIASLAAVHGIGKVTGLEARIKWPNDVLISGRKVCGILIENELKGNEVGFSVIGIGINTGWTPAAADELSLPATGLEAELGKGVARVAVIRELLTEIERLYLLLPDAGAILGEWRDRLATLGKPVRVEAGDAVLEGIAEDVDEAGALIVRLPDGTVHTVVAGDVTLRENPSR